MKPGKMEKVRIRVEFENSEILSKPRRSEELKRSWILLNHQLHKSISDLISHILRIFDLHLSCPNGILLSMEGFVLPPFESTSILNDEDIICVTKKRANILGGDNSVEEVDTNLLLLVNEEFEKETSGYRSEEEEDEEHEEEKIDVERSPVSKKRKISKHLKISKKRKHRLRNSDSAENVIDEPARNTKRKKRRCSEISDADGNDVNNRVDAGYSPEISKRNNKYVEPTSKIRRKKRRCSEISDADGNDVNNRVDAGYSPEISKRNNKYVEPTSKIRRNDPLGPIGEELKGVPQVFRVTTKVPSRSARRKKAKRIWLREIAKAEKEVAGSYPKEFEESMVEKKELVSHAQGLLHWKQSPEKVIDKEIAGHLLTSQNKDAKDELVPVVVRPGHIRFELLEDADEAMQQTHVSVENYICNGIASKKKGQKWGQENLSALRVSDHKSLSKEYSESLTANEDEEENEEEKETTTNDSVEFDKLPPLPSSPKEGDIIAYRLLELSSSWTPEMSSFRVGRVSSYNPQSTSILLMPVSGYPINLEKIDEDLYDETMKPENSLYNEDQSLKIDFSSLVDVRLIKQSKLSTAKAAANDSGNEIALANSLPTKRENEIQAQKLPEIGEVNKSVWNEISEAIQTKKAQLSSEENEGTKGRNSRSYRALRGSALGPTMAILRASKNSILE